MPGTGLAHAPLAEASKSGLSGEEVGRFALGQHALLCRVVGQVSMGTRFHFAWEAQVDRRALLAPGACSVPGCQF